MFSIRLSLKQSSKICGYLFNKGACYFDNCTCRDLILQYVTNEQNTSKLIDYQTCELYIQDLQINAKQFLNEFDSKCLEMKKLTSP